MYGLVLVIHVLVCLVLVIVILLQGGRGGLSETLSGGMAQSLFGGGVATFFTRMTAICASMFMVTCLGLAYLSTARGRSVIEQVPMTLPESLPGLRRPMQHPTSPTAAEPATPTTPSAAPASQVPASSEHSTGQ